MRRILLILGLLVPIMGAAQVRADTLRVMFWNLENFFDNRNDSTSVSDAEFSAYGTRHWSRRKFQAKCNAIAKSILWTAGQKGGLPDVIGVAEVENANVLRRLLQITALRKLDYRFIHFESPDPRGIDVALFYRSSKLALLHAKPCPVYRTDSTILPTRDILLAQFQTRGQQTVHFLVNHHPSKYGGAAVSEARRNLAVQRLRQLVDSLKAGPVIAMGDFNETPDNPVYKQLETKLVNLAKPLHEQGLGSIKYEGDWELIDLFFVTPDCLPARMEILSIPFLQVADGAHAGTKPLRTYAGPRYLGGVSDHNPVWLTLSF